MRIEPEISAATIVLLGHFNPQIFQPYWLANYEVISEEEAETANINFALPEITRFSVEGEFTVQVEHQRFSIERAVAPLVRIADISCRIFGDLLPHTPIQQMGINRLMHFDVGDQAVREEIGRKLAPREPWGDWGRLVSTGEGLRHGGLQSLTMTQRELSDRP